MQPFKELGIFNVVRLHVDGLSCVLKRGRRVAKAVISRSAVIIPARVALLYG